MKLEENVKEFDVDKGYTTNTDILFTKEFAIINPHNIVNIKHLGR